MGYKCVGCYYLGDCGGYVYSSNICALCIESFYARGYRSDKMNAEWLENTTYATNCDRCGLNRAMMFKAGLCSDHLRSDAEMLFELAAQGSDLDEYLLLTPDPLSEALVDAVVQKSLPAVTGLIKAGARPNTQDCYGNTVLSLAIAYNCREIECVLLSAGAHT